MTKVFTLIMYC